jgi:hypothetical protein
MSQARGGVKNQASTAWGRFRTVEGMRATISVRAAMAPGAAPLYAISGTERSGAFAGYMQRLYRDALPGHVAIEGGSATQRGWEYRELDWRGLTQLKEWQRMRR